MNKVRLGESTRQNRQVLKKVRSARMNAEEWPILEQIRNALTISTSKSH